MIWVLDEATQKMSFIYIIVFLLILLIWVPWIWRYYLRPHFAAVKIKQHLNEHPDKNKLSKTVDLLTTLYKDVHSTSVSCDDRKRLEIKDDSFIYGEIEFSSFIVILDRVTPKKGEVFYDLGSGSGKAIFTAALYYDLSKACGVEFLPGLHQLAIEQIKQAKKIIQAREKNVADAYLSKLSCIEFINQNFLNIDFSDADIVFINATCLHHSVWDCLAANLSNLKIGSRVIVLTKKILDEKFKIIYQGTELMSWGMNSVNIYIKQE